MNFIDLGISKPLVDALEKEAVRQPMPIQAEAIPALLKKKNAYVSAETGMGKTLAYLLPIFERTDPAVLNAVPENKPTDSGKR